MSEDEKRAWNRALKKVHEMIYKKWPVDKKGMQNSKAMDLQSEIIALMENTKNGEIAFRQNCVVSSEEYKAKHGK